MAGWIEQNWGNFGADVAHELPVEDATAKFAISALKGVRHRLNRGQTHAGAVVASRVASQAEWDSPHVTVTEPVSLGARFSQRRSAVVTFTPLSRLRQFQKALKQRPTGVEGSVQSFPQVTAAFAPSATFQVSDRGAIHKHSRTELPLGQSSGVTKGRQSSSQDTPQLGNCL
jgi:hypothetical protein